MLPVGPARYALYSGGPKVGNQASYYVNLQLDALPSWMTATGASGGYCVNASGVYTSKTAPRFDHTVNGDSYGLLLETATTNYGINNELTSGYTLSNASISSASNALYGSRTLFTLTQTAGATITKAELTQPVGIDSTFSENLGVALLAGSRTRCFLELRGTSNPTGAAGNSASSAFIIEGPALPTQITGTLWQIDYLDPTVPSVVAISRNKTDNSSEQVYADIFLQYQASGSAGDTLKFGMVMLEAVSGTNPPTSYIPAAGTATSRSADTISLNGAAATAATQGYSIVKTTDRLTGVLTYTSYAPGTLSFTVTRGTWVQEIGVYPPTVTLAQVNAMIAAQNIT